MKTRHGEVEGELNELHSNSGGGGGNPQRLAALSKELAELGEVVDLAGQLEGKRSEVGYGLYLCGLGRPLPVHITHTNTKSISLYCIIHNLRLRCRSWSRRSATRTRRWRPWRGRTWRGRGTSVILSYDCVTNAYAFDAFERIPFVHPSVTIHICFGSIPPRRHRSGPVGSFTPAPPTLLFL